MSTTSADERVVDGLAALVAGEWEEARDVFAAVVAVSDDPEALDGLGRALWWLRDPRGAVVNRERAYAGFRRLGQLARAARIALWLSREYALVWANAAASRGWLARAERLLAGVVPGSEQGWLELARAQVSTDPDESARHAHSALDVAVRAATLTSSSTHSPSSGWPKCRPDVWTRDGAARRGDGGGHERGAGVARDIRRRVLHPAPGVRARARHRAARAVDRRDGVVRPDVRPPAAAGVLPDVLRRRPRRQRAYRRGRGRARGRAPRPDRSRPEGPLHPPCCQARRAACPSGALRRGGDTPFRVRGRPGDRGRRRDLASGTRRACRSRRAARGAPPRRRSRRSDLDAAPRSARRGAGGRRAARRDAQRCRPARRGRGDRRPRPGGRSRPPRARSHRGGSRIGRGRGPSPPGRERLRALGLRLDAARARLELARALVAQGEPAAAEVAGRAFSELESLGASREADEAASILRGLGVKTRSGPRAAGLLTQREVEVLRLVGEGLTNARIAERLFISPKTVEHHVARIFRKLDVQTRTEAAAWAVRNLGDN